MKKKSTHLRKKLLRHGVSPGRRMKLNKNDSVRRACVHRRGGHRGVVYCLSIIGVVVGAVAAAAACPLARRQRLVSGACARAPVCSTAQSALPHVVDPRPSAIVRSTIYDWVPLTCLPRPRIISANPLPYETAYQVSSPCFFFFNSLGLVCQLYFFKRFPFFIREIKLIF